MTASGASSFSMFTDVTAEAFGPNERFLAPDHVALPANHQATPIFPDLDGDGVLDFFYHNHYKPSPDKAWDIALGCTVQGGVPCFESLSAGDLMHITEDPAVYANIKRSCKGKGGMEVDNCYTKAGFFPVDSHGVALVDIDRDGKLDMYISTGADHGTASGFEFDSFLMWGDDPAGVEQKSAGKVKLVSHFVGGRDAARAAGVHNPDASGRFTYMVDFNGDGQLDMVHGNQVRFEAEWLEDKGVDGGAPSGVGLAMLNNGDRTFSPLSGFAEYTRTMVLTDADGDGRANEIVLQRRECLPRLGGADPRVVEFCESRPCATTAIYRYDAQQGALVLLNPTAKHVANKAKKLQREVAASNSHLVSLLSPRRRHGKWKKQLDEAATCQSWCETSTDAWDDKCQDSRCAACSACPKDAKQMEFKACQGWCATGKDPWEDRKSVV